MSRRKAGVCTNVSQLRDTILPNDVKQSAAISVANELPCQQGTRPDGPAPWAPLFYVARRHEHSDVMPSCLEDGESEKPEQGRGIREIRRDGLTRLSRIRNDNLFMSIAIE